MTLGETLKAARKAHSLSQHDAADLVGISSEHLFRIECDSVPKPKPEVIRALCDLYGLDVKDVT